MTNLLKRRAADAPPAAGLAASSADGPASAGPSRENGAPPAAFSSILFPNGPTAGGESVEAPAFFRDLNLDRIVDDLTSGRDEYRLKPLFFTRLTDLDAVSYRHEVMRDLEDEFLFRSIKSFSAGMRRMRDHLGAAGRLPLGYEMERWFLDAADIYGETVEALRRDLQQGNPKSRGLLAFREYLAELAASSSFQTLRQETKKSKSGLSEVRYCLFIKGNAITVRNYDGEIDYSAAVEETFARFKQGAVKDYRVKFRDHAASLNHIELGVLELVARLNPEVFRALGDFCLKHSNYFETTIVDFDREIQFYVAWLEYAETFKRAGLTFCYPEVSDQSKEISSREGFDLALAAKLIREKRPVVCNDFHLHGRERILVVTGPNQGGKTTFARTFGQLHCLASLGCPVPGAEARLFFFDRLFTHFEREEDITTLRGKLQDDLLRIQGIFVQATPKGLVIINEIFSSTSVQDGVYLGRKVMETLSQLDVLGVCVTFLDELASANEKAVSMVAAVVPDDPTLRTFKIVRRPADGLSYAMAIAEKYRLTYERLRERIAP